MRIFRGHPATSAIFGLALLLTLVVRGNSVWLDTSITIGIAALIGLSVGLSYGQAGILTMAQGSFAAIGAYATAVATVKLGWSPFVGLLLAIAVPAAVAYPLARVVTRLEPLSVALATLALGTVVEIVLRSWDSVTGGYVGLAGIPPPAPITTGLGFQVLAWAFVVGGVFLYENVLGSAFGRALRTIKQDRARAAADGVPVSHVLSATFALSAAMAGTAGWVYAHYITYLGPTSLGTATSISALLMTVVGGATIVVGPIAGAVLLILLTHVLPAQEVQGLFYGAALIAILLVARNGILGYLAPRFARFTGGTR